MREEGEAADDNGRERQARGNGIGSDGMPPATGGGNGFGGRGEGLGRGGDDCFTLV